MKRKRRIEKTRVKRDGKILLGRMGLEDARDEMASRNKRQEKGNKLPPLKNVALHKLKEQLSVVELGHMANIDLGTGLALHRKSATPESNLTKFPDVGLDLRVSVKKVPTYRFEHQYASIRIQAWWRGEVTREYVWGPGGVYQTQAAVMIQRSYKGEIGRRKAKRVRAERDFRGARGFQNLRRRYCAKLKVAKARAMKRLNGARSLQRVYRGYKDRLVATRLRLERNNRCALLIQRYARGRQGRNDAIRRKKEDIRRRAALEALLERLEAIPANLKSTIDKLSDRELRRNGELLDRIVQDIVLLFAFNTRLDIAIRVLNRMLRLNDASVVANQAKAVAILASGSKPHFRSLKHSLFFVELAVDALSRCPTSSPYNPFDPKVMETETDITDTFLNSLDEVFYLSTILHRGKPKELDVVLNYGIVLQCIVKDYNRARIYWKKAAALLHHLTSIYSGQALENQKIRTATLVEQFDTFWSQPEVFDYCEGNEYYLYRRGKAICVYRKDYAPLIVLESQFLHITRSSVQDNSAAAMYGLPVELDQWARAKAFIGKILLQRERRCIRPRLWIPAIERERMGEVVMCKKILGAADIQRVARGMKARIEWRRRVRVREELDKQKYLLVEKRLVRERHRRRCRQAAIKVQAIFRSVQTRAYLAFLGTNACEIQRIARGMLGRLAFAEAERLARMGVLVKEVFKGGKTLMIDNGPQKCQVFLTVLRAGYNFLFKAIDVCTTEEYSGTVSQQRVEWLLGEYNKGKRKIDHVRKTMHEKVLEILLDGLRLSQPIAALGDLIKAEGKLTVVVTAVRTRAA